MRKQKHPPQGNASVDRRGNTKIEQGSSTDFEDTLQFTEYYLRASFAEEERYVDEVYSMFFSLFYSICFFELLQGNLRANIVSQSIQNDNTSNNFSIATQSVLTVIHSLYYLIPQIHSRLTDPSNIKSLDIDNLAEFIDPYLLEFELSNHQKQSLESAKKYYKDCRQKFLTVYQGKNPKLINIDQTIMAFLIMIITSEVAPTLTNIALSSIFIPILTWGIAKLSSYLITPFYLFINLGLSGQKPSSFNINYEVTNQFIEIIPFLDGLFNVNFKYTIQSSEKLEHLKNEVQKSPSYGVRNPDMLGHLSSVFFPIRILLKKYITQKIPLKILSSETNCLLRRLGFTTYIAIKKGRGNIFLGVDVIIPGKQNIRTLNISETRDILNRRINQRLAINECHQFEFGHQKGFALLLSNLSRKTDLTWYDWYEQEGKKGDLQIVLCCQLPQDLDPGQASEIIRKFLKLTDNNIPTIYNIEKDHNNTLLLICNDVSYLKPDFLLLESSTKTNKDKKKKIAEHIDSLIVEVPPARPIHPPSEEIEKTDALRRKTFWDKQKAAPSTARSSFNSNQGEANSTGGIKRKMPFLTNSYVLFKKEELVKMTKDIRDSTIENKILTQLREGCFFSNRTSQKLGIKVKKLATYQRESDVILFRIKACTSKRPAFILKKDTEEAHYIGTKNK